MEGRDRKHLEELVKQITLSINQRKEQMNLELSKFKEEINSIPMSFEGWVSYRTGSWLFTVADLEKSYKAITELNQELNNLKEEIDELGIDYMYTSIEYLNEMNRAMLSCGMCSIEFHNRVNELMEMVDNYHLKEGFDADLFFSKLYRLCSLVIGQYGEELNTLTGDRLAVVLAADTICEILIDYQLMWV